MRTSARLVRARVAVAELVSSARLVAFTVTEAVAGTLGGAV